jgi:hypothetical protein
MRIAFHPAALQQFEKIRFCVRTPPTNLRIPGMVSLSLVLVVLPKAAPFALKVLNFFF